MARKRARPKKAKRSLPRAALGESKAAGEGSAAPEPASTQWWQKRPAVAAMIFAWGFLAHLVFFQHGTSVLLFLGDGLYYLQKARHLAEGTALDADLPFHPPLPSWLLTPLWWTLPEDAVATASKAVMALLSAATYSVIYLLLAARRFPQAALFCFLLPTSFGELLLSASPNNEALYRLLLALLILLGLRRPIAGGVLHGLAALTRAEHVVFGLGLLVIGLWNRKRRRFSAISAGVAAAVLLPYTLAVGADLRAYNAEHAETLPEPLPTVVPVSFYGPLNFALAHTEDDIFFSRRKLPVSGTESALDPNHPVHNDYIVHGYGIAFRAIWADPGRFIDRSWRKTVHSLRAFAFGWTWRDLPKGVLFTRQPIDMAYATAPVYEGVVALLLLLGAWQLRRERWLLAVGFGLIAYRLAINVAFFPYLRSMMIAAPFALLLAFAGFQAVLRGVGLRRYSPRILAVFVGLVALVHVVSGLGERQYLGKGERDAQGRILDDRLVILKYDHPP